MKAWLRKIELETFKAEVIALPEAAKSFMIGRRDADLVIPSERVAKKQCALVTDGGRWLVEDMTSTGGTFVNGRRVHRHPLVHGDTLWLAGHRDVDVRGDVPEGSRRAVEAR